MSLFSIVWAGFSFFQGIAVQHARCYPCESRKYPPCCWRERLGVEEEGWRGTRGPFTRWGSPVRAPALFSRRDKIGIAKNSSQRRRRSKNVPEVPQIYDDPRRQDILLRSMPAGEERNAKFNGVLPPLPYRHLLLLLLPYMTSFVRVRTLYMYAGCWPLYITRKDTARAFTNVIGAITSRCVKCLQRRFSEREARYRFFF